MAKVKLNFEDLAASALSALVESNGGSLDTALWEIGIEFDSEKGKAIREWFGWDDDEELDEED